MNRIKYILLIITIMYFACNKQKSAGNSSKTDSALTSNKDSINDEEKIIFLDTYEPGCKFVIHKIYPSLPLFRFILFGDSAFSKIDSIIIISEKDSSIIQIIKSELPDYPFITFKDFNFDEYEDLMLSSGHGTHGNMDYDIWLYDTVANKFVKNRELSTLVNPDVDYEKELITTSWSGGMYFYSYDSYKLINGHLIHYEEDGEKDIPNSNIAIKYLIKLQNGKMDTVKLDTIKIREH